MKILYISNTAFFDADLGFIKAQNEINDFYCLINIPTYGRNATAIRIAPNFKKAGIYSASSFKEFEVFKDYLNLDKTFIIYRTSKKVFEPSNLQLQREIIKFTTQLKPNIIHLNNFLDFNFLYFLVKNKIKTLQTIHDPFPHSGENSLRKRMIRRINYFFISKKVLLNKSQKENFLKKNKINEKSVFISSLGTYDYLKLFKKSEIKHENSNMILFFGRISPYKGIEELCNAVLDLSLEIPTIQLTVAGAGDFWFDITPFQNHPNFQFINRYITLEEMVELFENARFIVCPYRDATQSGVVLSALGLNKPVIATDIGGIPEIIENKRNGLLIKPNDLEMLKKAIKELFTNNTLLDSLEKQISQSNKDGITSWERIVHNLQIFYNTVYNENHTN
jgi:glycosyltransferase involved in cell wall biosynthesis